MLNIEVIKRQKLKSSFLRMVYNFLSWFQLLPYYKPFDQINMQQQSKRLPECSGSQQDYNVPRKFIYLIVSVRLFMIFIPLNYDYPDQYWQGPQIGYKIYNRLVNQQQIGYETWQWTIDDPIRNPFYQLLLTLGYIGSHGLIYIIQSFQCNYNYFTQISQETFDTIMQLSPKFIQALLAMIGDIFVVKVLLFYFGKQRISLSSLILILSNWFYLTMLQRTYVNSLQSIIMTISFYYWQRHQFENHLKLNQEMQAFSSNDLISRSWILVGYVARPTSILPWVIIWPYELAWIFYRETSKILTKNKGQMLDATNFNKMNFILNRINLTYHFRVILKNLLQIFSMIFFSFLLGSIYYQKPISTQYNFIYVTYLVKVYRYLHLLLFQYNILLKWSQLFQVHGQYYYYLVSIPIIQGFYLVFLVVALFSQIFKKVEQFDHPGIIRKYQIITACRMTLMISLLLTLVSKHKQHRFLMVMMPLVIVINFCGYLEVKGYFLAFQSPSSQVTTQTILPSKGSLNSHGHAKFSLLIVVIVIWNFLMFYSVAIYPKGGFNILRQIRKDLFSIKNNSHQNKISVMYLCQPHSLPGYSIILRDVILLLPDQTPASKLKNQSQTRWLRQNPELLFNKLNSKYSRQKQIKNHKAEYVIVQLKYLNSSQLSNQLYEPDKEESSFLPKNYQFLHKKYSLVLTQNNRNLWQTLIFGKDQLYLFRLKKHNQKDER